MKPRIIFLVGPTASGKTEVSIELAKMIGAEIISCDSMQVYRGMNILTSKPGMAERCGIAHHCINFVPVTRGYDVSQYRHKALAAARALLKKGKVPLFVGGTGLYMTMLIDGIFDAKTENEGVRKKLYGIAARKGSAALHKALMAVDPAAATKIHPNDTRRIVRALEVYSVSGRTITELQQMRRGLCDDYDVRVICLDVARDELNRRIGLRVDGMFRRGIIGEVKRLLKKKLSRTAAAAIGIREVGAYLAGKICEDEARALMQKNTRHYARRQLTWFRKDKRIEWVRVSGRDTPRAVAAKIEKRL